MGKGRDKRKRNKQKSEKAQAAAEASRRHAACDGQRSIEKSAASG